MTETTVPAGPKPGTLTSADRAAEILGNMGDVRAMLRGVCAILAGMPESADQQGAERLLMMAQDRVAETYHAAETLTADLDNMGEVAHG